MKQGLLIAFGEIFLKSEPVKNLFKRKLEQNIFYFLKKQGIDFKISSFRERIFVETNEVKKTVRVLKKVFGIAWISESFYFPFEKTNKKPGIKEISCFVSENYSKWIKDKETFALRVKTENFEKNKVIEKVAENIDRKVDLDNPKKEINIEQRKQAWFLFFKKQKGAEGLPVGSGEKVLTLMSGGIDSPVASYLMAKRGAENVWIHFHSFPLVSKKSIDKTKELALNFLKYQPKLKVYFIPFHKIQVDIKSKADPLYRVLLYRREMLKISEKIAKKEKCKAIATGESLGQVSSQTLSNIAITNQAIKTLILRPLIGTSKEEIMFQAKKIGTYNISIKPQEDCCTLFVPKKSTAKGDIKKIKEIEKKLCKKTIKKAEKDAKAVIFS